MIVSRLYNLLSEIVSCLWMIISAIIVRRLLGIFLTAKGIIKWSYLSIFQIESIEHVWGSTWRRVIHHPEEKEIPCGT